MVLSRSSRVLVIAEPSSGGAVASATLGAVTLAHQLCQLASAEWSLFAAMSESEAEASPARRLGAQSLVAAPIGPAAHVPSERYVPTICRLVHQRRFDYVIGAATTFGRDLLPRLAGFMDAAYVGECTGIRVAASGFHFLRPIHAGAVTAECAIQSATILATARPSEFAPASMDQPSCPVELVEVDVPSTACPTFLDFQPVVSARPKLVDARVVITGGRPLGARFFEVLGPLADAFGAALGATRALCDAGHVPADFQVGQTGKIVAPELYFAIGVSGSVQHVAGMRKARTIVAINSDPRAPIFDYADVGIVADLFRVVPGLVETIRRSPELVRPEIRVSYP